MKLTKKRGLLNNRPINPILLAFWIPFLGILMTMLIKGCEPFGNKSMLYSDMYHQYYPFFLAFRRNLFSGQSLLHIWDIGMGMDFLGLYSYYLASPLNFLSILVPEGLMLEFFSLLVPLKLGLASMCFALFLKKTFDSNDLSVALFGCFYGLCAWGLAYQWNVMWLDTFALLPLVVLGTIQLLRDKKFLLYTITLFLSVWSNYYMGLFTCIFVLLVFICYEICRCKSIGRFFSDLLRIGVFSILAIGMTAVLELPTLAALKTTQSSVNEFPTTFRLNISSEHNWKGLLDAMRQVAGNTAGGLEPSFKEGLPNLYCGILSNLLAVMFLLNRQVRVRDKICTVFLLLFFNVSFIIRQLDYIWHGFHFTNMIPYRFSFLYSFVVLYMAYRAWTLRQSFRPWHIIAASVVAIGLCLCSNTLWNGTHNDILIFTAYNGAFVLLYVSILIYSCLPLRKPKDASDEEEKAFTDSRQLHRNYASFALCAVMVAELALTVTGWAVWFPSTAVSNYPKGTEHTASIIRYMKEREDDNLFYRTEVTHSQTLNDGALNNYRGISTFTSSANVKITEFMKALGYGAKNTYNRYCFEESSPVANLFLGLKYMIERDGKVEENPYFDIVHSYDKVYLLENNAYLPLGFLAESQLVNVDFAASGNRFVFQNDLIRAATGLDADVWELMQGNCLTISGLDATLSSNSPASGYCTYTTESGKSGSVTYTYTAYKPGFLCLNFELSKKNGISVSKNGTELYTETYSLPQMLSVCQVVPGDVIDVKLSCKAAENGTITVTAGLLDEEVFRNAHEILSASTLELTSFESTHIQGTINCNRNGLLYTSIPQNGGWTAIVDGKPAMPVTVGDAMVGLLLTEGQHEVEFVYQNTAFSLGLKISLGCLGVFGIICLITYLPRKKGKYAQ